ncbi:MAG: hypothetical protein OHK0026_07340 [Rhodocyclaceae bacterium]
MDIASLVVSAAPQFIDSVRAQLRAIPGLDLHGEDDNGRFVVTLEDGEAYRVEDSIEALNGIEGVMSVALVYKYCDDGFETAEADHGNESA